jgi:hypothetical protein
LSIEEGRHAEKRKREREKERDRDRTEPSGRNKKESNILSDEI